MQLLIRAARSQRDRVLLQVAYAGGLRVSEIVALTWADVISRDDKVQLSITGKGGRVRQVLLPKSISRALLALRGDAGANDPVFASRKKGAHLDAHSVHVMVKRTAKRAGINEAVSPTGCVTPTEAMRSTAAPRWSRCRQRSGTLMWVASVKMV